MSYGEGNLHERVDELERENAVLKSLVCEYHECLVEHHRAHQVPHRIAVEWMAARLEKLGIETEGGA